MARISVGGRVWASADAWQDCSIFDTNIVKSKLETAINSDTYKSAYARRTNNNVVAAYLQEFDPTENVYLLSARIGEEIDGNAIVALNIKERYYIAFFIDGFCVFDDVWESLTVTEKMENKLDAAAFFFMRMKGDVELIGDVKHDGVNLILFPQVAAWSCGVLADAEYSNREINVEELLSDEEEVLKAYLISDINDVSIPRLRRYRNAFIGLFICLLFWVFWPEPEPEIVEVYTGPTHINPYETYIDYLSVEAINIKRRLEHEVILLRDLENLKGWDVVKLTAKGHFTQVVVTPQDETSEPEDVKRLLNDAGFGSFEVSGSGYYMSQREVETDVQAVNRDSLFDEAKDEAIFYHISSLQEVIATSLRYFWDEHQYSLKVKETDLKEKPKGVSKETKFKRVTIDLNEMDYHDIDTIGSLINGYPITFISLEMNKNKNSELGLYDGTLVLELVGG